MNEIKQQHCKCKNCNHNLSDPISMNIGFGPVCRVNIKLDAATEKSGWVFGERADYEYQISDTGVICIVDLLGAKSVTNDLDNILVEMSERGVDFEGKWLIYRDSMGIWDGIRATVTPGREIPWKGGVRQVRPRASFTFFPLTETDRAKAIAKVINYNPNLAGCHE